jgi:hypothetical protein
MSVKLLGKLGSSGTGHGMEKTTVWVKKWVEEWGNRDRNSSSF